MPLKDMARESVDTLKDFLKDSVIVKDEHRSQNVALEVNALDELSISSGSFSDLDSEDQAILNESDTDVSDQDYFVVTMPECFDLTLPYAGKFCLCTIFSKAILRMHSYCVELLLLPEWRPPLYVPNTLQRRLSLGLGHTFHILSLLLKIKSHGSSTFVVILLNIESAYKIGKGLLTLDSHTLYISDENNAEAFLILLYYNSGELFLPSLCITHHSCIVFPTKSVLLLVKCTSDHFQYKKRRKKCISAQSTGYEVIR